MSRIKSENPIDKFKFEKTFLAQGARYIAGVDEVGRGPLAGPVVCAAVVMPLEEGLIVEGVDDSKKLSQKRGKRSPLGLRNGRSPIPCTR